jgi:hypothetical protein
MTPRRLDAAFAGACALVLACPLTLDAQPKETHPMPTPPSASRPSAPVVSPVEIDGVRYEQDDEAFRHGGGQLGGYLVALDTKTGERLWMLKVYQVDPSGHPGIPSMGRYFKSLRRIPDRNALEIVNEAGGVYEVDLGDRSQVGGPPER